MTDLYILGNGIDLFFDMKTTYGDFIHIKEINNMIRTYGGSNRDCEVENSKFNLFLSYLCELKHTGVRNWYQLESHIINYILYTVEQEELAEVYETLTLYQKIIKEKKKKHVENYILNELNEIEKIFGEYIKEQQKIQKNSLHLLQLFSLDRKDGLDSIHILNFNYSTYLKDSIKDATPWEKIEVIQINIHSDCESPIFGIDLTEIKKVSLKKKYRKSTIEKAMPILKMATKTSRIINKRFNYNSRKIDKGVTPDHLFWKLPNPSELRKIIFFGHSLSNSDYSYFQSIFDYYNLYDSNITLQFLYNRGLGLETISSHKEAIYNLFENYGKTFQNKNKGKNLLHKLLLEQRVMFEGIPL